MIGPAILLVGAVTFIWWARSGGVRTPEDIATRGGATFIGVVAALVAAVLLLMGVVK